jgi:glycosyltransferase involved in cell wall biosynthesis
MGAAMNGSRGRVAVVVPTHERDVELERAIRSIGAQTHPAACVVVVDDVGSSGAKAAAERAALELPVRYVNAQDSPAIGAGASRNLGARHADPTDFIAFLDDDDYWSPFFLERTLGRIDETGADLVASGAAMSDGHSTRAHAWHAAEGLSADDVVAVNPGVTGSNFVVRRAVFHSIGGFDDGQWVFNDLDFFLRFLQWGGTYAVTGEDLVTQTVSRGGHLSSRSDRRAAGIERYIAKHTASLNPHQRRVLVRQANLARLHRGQNAAVFLRAFANVVRHSTGQDWTSAVRARLGSRLGYN